MTLSAKRQNCPQPTFSSVNHAKGSILKTFEHCPHEREGRLPTYIPNLESLIKLFQPSTVIKHLFYPTQQESRKWSCKQVVIITDYHDHCDHHAGMSGCFFHWTKYIFYPGQSFRLEHSSTSSFSSKWIEKITFAQKSESGFWTIKK